MNVDEVKPCGACEFGPLLTPLVVDTYCMGIKISTTIMCTCCYKKVTRITQKRAIKAWNRRK